MMKMKNGTTVELSSESDKELSIVKDEYSSTAATEPASITKEEIPETLSDRRFSGPPAKPKPFRILYTEGDRVIFEETGNNLKREAVIFAPDENSTTLDKNNIDATKRKSEFGFPEEENQNPQNRLILKLGASFKLAPTTNNADKSSSTNSIQQEELNLLAHENNLRGNEQTNELITSVSSSEESEEQWQSLRYGESFRKFAISLEGSRIDAKDWDQENLVFSPFSLFTVLSMLLLGSEGKTFSVQKILPVFV